MYAPVYCPPAVARWWYDESAAGAAAAAQLASSRLAAPVLPARVPAPVLSPQARGNPTTVFISVTLVDQRRDTMEQFEAALREEPLVTQANLMSGEYDYLLKAEVPETDSFERVHREVLAALPGVQRLVTHFSLRSVIVES